MDALNTTIGFGLAVVFGIAAATKLKDPSGTVRMLEAFGIRRSLSPALASLVTIGEVTVAALLVGGRFAWYGALGALALLSLFTIAISYNLAKGRAPECRCFGHVSSRPVGWQTILRNLVLAAAAGMIVWAGPDATRVGVLNWFADLSTVAKAFTVAGCLASYLIGRQAYSWIGRARLQRRTAVLASHIDAASGSSNSSTLGIVVGAAAPDFSLTTPSGAMMTLGLLRAEQKPILLVFTDPGCAACTALLPQIGRWDRELDEVLTIAIVSRGTVGGNQTHHEAPTVKHLLLQNDHEVAEAYGIIGTPSAVIIRSNGTVGSPLIAGPSAILEYVATVFSGAAIIERGGFRNPPPAAQFSAAATFGRATGSASPFMRVVAESRARMSRREGLKSFTAAVGALVFGIGKDGSPRVGRVSDTDPNDDEPLMPTHLGAESCREAEQVCIKRVSAEVLERDIACRKEYASCARGGIPKGSPCFALYLGCLLQSRNLGRMSENTCRAKPCGNCRECRGGQCVEAKCPACTNCNPLTNRCNRTECPPCEVCAGVDGKCVPVEQLAPCVACDRNTGTMTPKPCPSGQFCADGDCVACVGFNSGCRVNEVCRNGTCEAVCAEPPAQGVAINGTQYACPGPNGTIKCGCNGCVDFVEPPYSCCKCGKQLVNRTCAQDFTNCG